MKTLETPLNDAQHSKLTEGARKRPFPICAPFVIQRKCLVDPGIATLSRKNTCPLWAMKAYAKRHLRVAPVVGTTIRLSLEEPGVTRSATSTLRPITDGAPLTMDDLRQLLPSLGSVVWVFSNSGAAGRYELATVANDIRVNLFMGVENGLPEIDAESKLRGTAARLVVELEYGG
ncbi:hypothetical protein [Paraburkholderia sp. GAS334]|uniref:hypothetical protein n=1 Tax=Paraburkholderia sp. GAS334 TaxID=3035131 RepID=UPI003D1D2334